MVYAGVAELADALDSKSSDRKVVEVQVLSPVLENRQKRGGSSRLIASKSNLGSVANEHCLRRSFHIGGID
jgi:hypothetical protein